MPSHLAKRLWIFTRGKRSYQSANMKSDVRVGSKSIVGRCPLITALQPRAKVLPRCCYVAKVPRPAMRPYRVGERQTGMDARMKLAGSEHLDDRTHAGAAFIDQVVPGVDGELPHRRRVLAQAKRRLQIELGLAAKRAVNDERAAGRKQRDVAGNARSANWIDDDVDAAAFGYFAHTLVNLIGLAVDDVVRPEITGKACLLRTADHADHGEVRSLRQINQRIAHAASGGIDEHAISLP